MQRYRAVILIFLLGVVPVVAAFFAALAFLGTETADPVAAAPVSAAVETPPPPPAETRSVVTAARGLPVGTLIGDEDLTTSDLDVAAFRSGHVETDDREGPEQLHGFAVREALAPGQAVEWSMVVGPDQRGFLAAVLRPGMRAVTIRVGPATSHAGLVDPGDRVDVILSAEVVVDDRERAVLARTIVDDVRVLAVDRWVGDLAEGSGSGVPAERTEIVTATLEVTPGEGDRLALGGHEGVLSLAVRSLAAAPPRGSEPAVDLRDLLLPDESESAMAMEERLRAEIELLEERLREEEEDRLRLEREGRIRLEEELAQVEERLRAEMRAAGGSPEEEPPEVKRVRIFRGDTPAQEVEFEQAQ